jgi:hypothetical protein
MGNLNSWAFVFIVGASNVLACGGDDSSAGPDGSSGTSGSDGGSEAASCPLDDSSSACDICEANHCCAEETACYADTACSGADNALDDCTSSAADAGMTALAACYTTFKATNATAAAIYDCKNTNCKTPCEIP